MFVKVTKPEVGNNKGSCRKLADYLDKDKETEFFDQNSESVDKYIVEESIDNNAGGLHRNDAKFYMVVISPSDNEIRHLIGRDINNYDELTATDKDQLFANLKNYTHDVMDEYAKNFERPNIEGNKDLLYFSRIETCRTYSAQDEEVKNGLKYTGDKKEGLNIHIHVIVSRQSKDKTAKLSPNGRFIGASWERDGKTVQRGFSHTRFKQNSIERFNQRFQYRSNNNEEYKGNYDNNSAALNGAVKGQIQGKVAGTIKRELIRDNFKVESKMIDTTKRVTSIISSPALAIKKEAVRAAKSIISAITQTKQI